MLIVYQDVTPKKLYLPVLMRIESYEPKVKLLLTESKTANIKFNRHRFIGLLREDIILCNCNDRSKNYLK